MNDQEMITAMVSEMLQERDQWRNRCRLRFRIDRQRRLPSVRMA